MIVAHEAQRPQRDHDDSHLSRDAVVWAYRLFLDRDPDDEEAIESKLLFLETTQELRAHFLSSPEFQYMNSWPLVPNEDEGLPLPPPRLIDLVAGCPEPVWFLGGGRKAAKSIRAILANNGISLEELDAILDFGCGCGRVMRHWRSVEGPQFFGSDYNSELITWCRENLPFARVEVNDLAPPLPYDDASFDLVYALSVFTHLTESLQRAWLAELARLLPPDGLLILTVHGRYYLPTLSPEERARFKRGELVVREIEHAGTNLCGVYHPRSHLRRGIFGQLFEVLDHVEQGAKGNPFQDLVLLKKRS